MSSRVPSLPPPAPTAPPALPEDADVVVVGGGIMGLATAYHLARLDPARRIVVLDKTYLCGGASGRNGGGVRAQWSSETNIRLMKESVRLCAEFATEMRINVWFRQGGYLFLAHSEARAKELRASVELQHSNGLRTRMIGVSEVKKLVPELDTRTIVAASYNPDDGVVFPWPFVWGYARACEQHGVSLHTFTEVLALETAGGGKRISGVVTNRGRIRTPLVVNAAGAWSPEVARLVGIALPNHPHRHEICVTEPLKPFLRPLVADLASGLYFSQSMRGEIVGGITNENVPEGLDQNSSAEFLGLYASALIAAMPVLGAVRVLRQWAGCYDLTPDGSPIVGFIDELDGFYQLCGFMGHGFMMAPIMGKLAAEHLVGGKADPAFEPWNFRRFRTGKLVRETMILG
jgi:sarcosine oxidase subunit beta